MTRSNLTRLHPHGVLEAAGYVRVSLQRQAEGHSPEVQREAIKRLAAEQGYALTLMEEDHERGSKVTRAGYQRIIEAVRRGTIHAVIVYLFDRWGRDGGEWIARAREFERLGVLIISVQEGRDEGGLMRFVRAGMAEEESRKIARRVRPTREEAARKGIHQGRTPYGYQRIYPAWDGKGKRPPGELRPDEPAAWVVQELYRRYAAGGWALRDLVLWLNTDPRCGPSPTGKAWNVRTTANLVRNPVYKGAVSYNRRPQGLYERAAAGTAFTVPGHHTPLVSSALWEAVQHRLTGASRSQTYNRAHSRSGLAVALGAGLMECPDCGGRLYRHYRDDRHRGQYICLTRHSGSGMCGARGYGANVAHAALLAEVRRLRGAPWTPGAERRLLGDEGQTRVEAAAATARAVETERERLRRHTRLMSLMDGEPTAEQIATFREVSAEISARIRALEAQVETHAQRAVQMPRLRDLHAKLTRTEIPILVERLQAQGDETALRELVLELVASARLVERLPDYHPVWGRLAVTWTPDVQTLLDAGLLRLDGPVPAPALGRTARMERNRLAQQRYRARKKAALQREPG